MSFTLAAAPTATILCTTDAHVAARAGVALADLFEWGGSCPPREGERARAPPRRDQRAASRVGEDATASTRGAGAHLHAASARPRRACGGFGPPRPAGRCTHRRFVNSDDAASTSGRLLAPARREPPRARPAVVLAAAPPARPAAVARARGRRAAGDAGSGSSDDDAALLPLAHDAELAAAVARARWRDAAARRRPAPRATARAADAAADVDNDALIEGLDTSSLSLTDARWRGGARRPRPAAPAEAGDGGARARREAAEFVAAALRARAPRRPPRPRPRAPTRRPRARRPRRARAEDEDGGDVARLPLAHDAKLAVAVARARRDAAPWREGPGPGGRAIRPPPPGATEAAPARGRGARRLRLAVRGLSHEGHGPVAVLICRGWGASRIAPGLPSGHDTPKLRSFLCAAFDEDCSGARRAPPPNPLTLNRAENRLKSRPISCHSHETAEGQQAPTADPWRIDKAPSPRCSRCSRSRARTTSRTSCASRSRRCPSRSTPRARRARRRGRAAAAAVALREHLGLGRHRARQRRARDRRRRVRRRGAAAGGRRARAVAHAARARAGEQPASPRALSSPRALNRSRLPVFRGGARGRAQAEQLGRWLVSYPTANPFFELDEARENVPSLRDCFPSLRDREKRARCPSPREHESTFPL